MQLFTVDVIENMERFKAANYQQVPVLNNGRYRHIKRSNSLNLWWEKDYFSVAAKIFPMQEKTLC